MTAEEPADALAGAARRDPELDPPFEVVGADAVCCPLVLSSPHSGSIYPGTFLASARLDAVALRRSEDAFVDELFAGAALSGAPLLRARFPRAYLDLNREPYELDPRMFDGKLPGFVNTRSVRVAGGLGTIARVVGEAQEIYAGRLRVADALERIERLYKPYHAALRRLLDEAQRRFGFAVLIDCHSMPSAPAIALAGTASGERRTATDFVLGDRYGTSCAPSLVQTLERTIRDAGYVVQRNKPYAGGFITEHYGTPPRGVHAIQIEVNRALYMNERLLQRNDAFDRVKADLSGILTSFAAAAAVFGQPGRAAAE